MGFIARIAVGLLALIIGISLTAMIVYLAVSLGITLSDGVSIAGIVFILLAVSWFLGDLLLDCW